MFQRGTIFRPVVMNVYSYQATVELNNKCDLSLLFTMHSLFVKVVLLLILRYLCISKTAEVLFFTFHLANSYNSTLLASWICN